MIKLQTEITSEIFRLLNELDIFGKLQHVAAWLDKKIFKVHWPFEAGFSWMNHMTWGPNFSYCITCIIKNKADYEIYNRKWIFMQVISFPLALCEQIFQNGTVRWVSNGKWTSWDLWIISGTGLEAMRIWCEQKFHMILLFFHDYPPSPLILTDNLTF